MEIKYYLSTFRDSPGMKKLLLSVDGSEKISTRTGLMLFSKNEIIIVKLKMDKKCLTTQSMNTFWSKVE